MRRIVEVAGLTRGVHFTEQLRVVGEDSAIKPDMVVTLSDDRSIVIDAKVPLDALLSQPSGAPESFASSGPSAAEVAARHASAVGAHIDQLASKGYWRQFTNAPEFVVLFLPAESLLGQALSRQARVKPRRCRRQLQQAGWLV